MFSLCMYVCMHACMYVCIYIYIYMTTHLHVVLHTLCVPSWRVQGQLYLHVIVYTVCKCVCMCVCVYVCVCDHDSVNPLFHKLPVLYSDGNWRVKYKSWTIKYFHNFLSTERKAPQLKNGMRGHSALELPPL